MSGSPALVRPSKEQLRSTVETAKARGWIREDPKAVMARYAMSLEVTNLDAVERAFLDTLISVLTDPKLASHRADLRAGLLTLAVEGDEVTWINPQEASIA